MRPGRQLRGREHGIGVLKRDELARHGLSIDDAQMVVMSAIGGDTVFCSMEAAYEGLSDRVQKLIASM